jgi:carboxyl-terminal processing protease
MRRNPERPHRPRVSLALVAILGVAVVGSTLAIAQRSSDYRFFDPLIEVKNVITRYAAEEPDAEALQRAAIEGMIQTLNDPYAVYVPPQLGDEFEKELTGEYVGIGAEVNMVDGVFTIVTPMDGSPAFRAGVMAGDRVRFIDGAPTEGLTIDQCINRLVGEDGTRVVITVERAAGELVEIPIVREPIRARAVRGFLRKDDADASWDFLLDATRRIGYIRVSQFTPNAAAEFSAALDQLGAPEGRLAGLIIDLRWNPGGLLDQAVRMADRFLDSGVIVSTRGRAYPEQIARAGAPGTLPNFPIAVLINGQSASASEILAGALLENGRAIVVGERSFGKGSVQSVHPLSGAASGASLKLTEQRYYLPSGRSIQRTETSAEWGVDPSPGFYIPVVNGELVELVRARREAEILDARHEPRTRPDADPSWILEHMKDRQLAEAVRAVGHHLETGDWPHPEAAASPDERAGALQEAERLMRTRDRLLRELDRLDRRIEVLGGSGGPAPDRDLWDDALDLVGGVVVVQDPDGNIVATLRITGPELERWLAGADVRAE